MSHTHQAAVLQLQQELASAQQHSHALSRQLQDMADSHLQVGLRHTLCFCVQECHAPQTGPGEAALQIKLKGLRASCLCLASC